MALEGKRIYFSQEKNIQLKDQRGVGFEDVLLAIEVGAVLDDLAHPNKDKYPGQSILIITVKNHVYIVPYVEDDKSIFLKTIIPSRKMNQRYNKKVKRDDN